MVHIPVYARQVLQSRQRLVDGGVIDNLLDDTTTATQTNGRVAGAAVAAAAGTTSTGTSTVTNTNTKAAVQTTATDTLTTDTSTRVPPLPTVTTTTSSSSSTSLTTTSSSTLPTTTSTSSTISTTLTPPPPQSTSTVPAGVQVVTVSSIPAAASTSLAPNGATAQAPVPFLENTAAKAAVFSLAGLVGLGLLIFIISLIVRRVRQKRLVEDAVSFNPSDLLDHRSDIERVNSRSSVEKAPYYGSDSGHSNYSRGGGVQPTYAATYDYNQPTYDYNQPSYDYNGQQGYYPSQQQQAYGGYNNNPVQLPSQNIGRATPPPLLPSMNGTPQEAALRSGGSGYLGGPNPPGLQQQQQGSSIRRSPSGTGSIVDNPYLGAGGYKVANV